MKTQIFICLTALVLGAASISAPHYGKQNYSSVTINDTVPKKNKIQSTDSAKEWHNNADNVNDTLQPRRDSSGHPPL